MAPACPYLRIDMCVDKCVAMCVSMRLGLCLDIAMADGLRPVAHGSQPAAHGLQPIRSEPISSLLYSMSGAMLFTLLVLLDAIPPAVLGPWVVRCFAILAVLVKSYGTHPLPTTTAAIAAATSHPPTHPPTHPCAC